MPSTTRICRCVGGEGPCPPTLHPGRMVAILMLCFLFGALFPGSPSLAAEPDTVKPAYRMGVFPFLSPGTLEVIFAPIAAELGQALGREVQFESASSFEKFMGKLEAREFDIAHIQPFDYVGIAAKAGYLPLATRNEKLFAVFAVKNDSPLRKAIDLRGKILGLPPKVAAVSRLAKVALLQAGIKPEHDLTLNYFTTHQSCLQQLQIGNVDSCASGPPILRVIQEETGNEFRVLMKSPEIPQTLFVVHSRVPKTDRDVMEKTLLSTRLSGVDPKLRDLFFGGKTSVGTYFRQVKDSDFDPVRLYMIMLKDVP